MKMADQRSGAGRMSSSSWFSVAIVCVCVVAVAIHLVAFFANNSAKTPSAERDDLAEMASAVRFHDFELTSVALLAVTTGERTYVDQYRVVSAALDSALLDGRTLAAANDVVAPYEAIVRTNGALLAVEERSLAQSAAGDRTGAYRTLTSERYDALKSTYEDRWREIVEKLDRADAKALTQANRRSGVLIVTSVLAGSLVVLFLVGSGIGLRRSLRRQASLELELRAAATHEPLTGLANRALLSDRISLAGRRRDRRVVAMFYFDLDGFKIINDAYGHPCGDIVLTEVARRLLSCARASDTVARVGGDEFAVFVDGLAAESEVSAMARRFLVALSAPIDIGTTTVTAGASIGSVTVGPLAAFPTAEDLIRHSDLAMYAAKESDSVKWVEYDPSMEERVLRNAELTEAIVLAFARREFEVWYQPIVDLRTGELAGAEALVRWQHPERGLVSPDAFLSVVAENGRMRELTQFVLGEACRWAYSRQLAEPAAPRFVVAVNISPRELIGFEVVADIRHALEESGLAATSLTLEVTETSLFGNTADIAPTLAKLRSIGVSIAVDDFGTGFSSFSHLRQLPVDIVKIDRSFTDGLATELEDSTVVAAVARLAQTLSLAVVAEGVEERKQLVALSELGCEFAQGYLFSPPRPAVDVPSTEDIRLIVDALDVLGPVDRAPVEQYSVVVADDVESERRLLIRGLERNGRFVVTGEGEDGLDAVRLASSLNPQVVLLDIDMPELDGLSALPLILASAPATKVVILSGHVTDGLVERAHIGGALACMEKGFAEVGAQLLRILEPLPANL